jgi:hypothetical protein
MFAYVRNNLYLCKGRDSRGVATRRQGQTDSLSLLSFVGLTNNVGSMKQEEIWKPVVGFENHYAVSSFGRVKAVARVVSRTDGAIRTYEEQILSLRMNKGYLIVQLNKCNRVLPKRVHRLVAEAFIPNSENKPCIDHINTDKTDNRIENLRWVTHSENMRNPITRAKVLSRDNEVIRRVIKSRKESGNIKTVYQFDIDGRLYAVHGGLSEASRATGVGLASIRACCAGTKSPYSAGFLWSYSPIAPIRTSPIIERNKRIAMFTLKHEFIALFDNSKEASRMSNVGIDAIRTCCRGITKSSGKYIWEYADELQ